MKMKEHVQAFKISSRYWNMVKVTDQLSSVVDSMLLKHACTQLVWVIY
jgi:hypothetical protein